MILIILLIGFISTTFGQLERQVPQCINLKTLLPCWMPANRADLDLKEQRNLIFCRDRATSNRCTSREPVKTATACRLASSNLPCYAESLKPEDLRSSDCKTSGTALPCRVTQPTKRKILICAIKNSLTPCAPSGEAADKNCVDDAGKQCTRELLVARLKQLAMKWAEEGEGEISTTTQLPETTPTMSVSRTKKTRVTNPNRPFVNPGMNGDRTRPTRPQANNDKEEKEKAEKEKEEKAEKEEKDEKEAEPESGLSFGPIEDEELDEIVKANLESGEDGDGDGLIDTSSSSPSLSTDTVTMYLAIACGALVLLCVAVVAISLREKKRRRIEASGVDGGAQSNVGNLALPESNAVFCMKEDDVKLHDFGAGDMLVDDPHSNTNSAPLSPASVSAGYARYEDSHTLALDGTGGSQTISSVGTDELWNQLPALDAAVDAAAMTRKDSQGHVTSPASGSVPMYDSAPPLHSSAPMSPESAWTSEQENWTGGVDDRLFGAIKLSPQNPSDRQIAGSDSSISDSLTPIEGSRKRPRVDDDLELETRSIALPSTTTTTATSATSATISTKKTDTTTARRPARRTAAKNASKSSAKASAKPKKKGRRKQTAGRVPNQSEAALAHMQQFMTAGASSRLVFNTQLIGDATASSSTSHRLT